MAELDNQSKHQAGGSSQGVVIALILVTMPMTTAATKPEQVADVELAPLAAIRSNGNGKGNYAVNRLS